MKCWLYIYENRTLNSVYIGIGDSMERVFGSHNQKATNLRDDPGTLILQTATPFTFREDARKAEAIAIHVAAFAGLSVSVQDGNDQVLSATNISGMKSSRELEPAIFAREGTVALEDFEGTVFVPLSSRDDTGELSAYGGHSGAAFAPRAQRWWHVTKPKRTQIVRLVALLKGSGNRILGSWKVDQNGDWAPHPGGAESAPRWRSAISIPLVDPSDDNFGDIKGMRVTGFRMNSSVGYSPDLRGAEPPHES